MDPLRARALDIGLEDGGVRSPLSGLFPKNLPVPSIPTSLENIGKKHPDLAPDGKCIKLARRHAKTIDAVHTRGMSEDEVIALILYTIEAVPREESLYYLMNAALRGKNRSGVSEWRDFIWLLLHAMRKIEKPSERSVYRGIKIEPGMFGSSRPNLKTGLDVTWSGFSSTASTINVMNTFLGTEGERIMYDIELTEPLARDIRPFSVFPSENELLLPPNFSFEIVSTFDTGGGLTMVQCKQTETLDVLLDFGATPSTWNVPVARPPQPGMPPQGQTQQSAEQTEQMRMMQEQMQQMQQMQMQQMQVGVHAGGGVQNQPIEASALQGRWLRPGSDDGKSMAVFIPVKFTLLPKGPNCFELDFEGASDCPGTCCHELTRHPNKLFTREGKTDVFKYTYGGDKRVLTVVDESTMNYEHSNGAFKCTMIKRANASAVAPRPEVMA